MKKIIKVCILSLIIILSLASCGTIEDDPTNQGTQIDDNQNNNNNNPDDNNQNNQNNPDNNTTEGVKFSVSLIYNKKIFIPDEEINVIWKDEYSSYQASINSNGFAEKVLDGDFNVYLDKTPKGYTYNPNIYVANTDSPVIEIELIKISRITLGTGKELYNEYQITQTGTYQSTITSKSKKVFYEYSPKKAGVYVVESLVNVYDDVVNPKLDIYSGTFAAKFFTETIDAGGKYIKGGYTKNFKWIVEVSEQRIGNVFTFAISANTKTGLYPVTVDFTISYEGDYYEGMIVSKVIDAEEANFKTPEFSKSEYRFVNSDGGSGNYYGGTANGSGLLDGTNFKYNEETGYYHHYDKTTNTFGEILCAYITKPCAYYEESLSMIESHGNKNLTVSNGTENYKQFIENSYAAACNSDGVCYVTKELMEFLQKFSVSQRLFFDGNGFVESTGVYAIEQDQWLFACGYYQKIS